MFWQTFQDISSTLSMAVTSSMSSTPSTLSFKPRTSQLPNGYAKVIATLLNYTPQSVVTSSMCQVVFIRCLTWKLTLHQESFNLGHPQMCHLTRCGCRSVSQGEECIECQMFRSLTLIPTAIEWSYPSTLSYLVKESPALFFRETKVSVS